MTTPIYPEKTLAEIQARFKKNWKWEGHRAAPKHFRDLEKLLGRSVPEEIVQLNSAIDGFSDYTSVSLLGVAGAGYGASIMSYLRDKKWPRKAWIPVGKAYFPDVFCVLAERRFKAMRPIGLVDCRSLKMKYLVASSLPKLIELWLAIGSEANDDWHRDKKTVLKIDPELARVTAYPKAWEVEPAHIVPDQKPDAAKAGSAKLVRRSRVSTGKVAGKSRVMALVRKRLGAEVSSSLDPADEKHVKRMETFLGRPLPAGLRAFLAFADGCCPDWGVQLYGVTEKNAAASMLGIMKSKRHRWMNRWVIPVGHDGWAHHWCLVDEPRYKGNGPVCAVPVGGRKIDFVVASSYEVFLKRIATVDWGFACAKSRSTKRKVLAMDPGIVRYKEYRMPWEWED